MPRNAKTEDEKLDDASFESPDVLTAASQGRLKSFVDRLQRLEEDKKAVMDDMKEVFAEAKGEGFDVKILRLLLRRLKQDAARIKEERAILELYAHAVGCEDLI